MTGSFGITLGVVSAQISANLSAAGEYIKESVDATKTYFKALSTIETHPGTYKVPLKK